MIERICCYINYMIGEDACGKPARCKHGDADLCAEHYDLVLDYVSGMGASNIVFGYDLSLNQEPVFFVTYK